MRDSKITRSFWAVVVVAFVVLAIEAIAIHVYDGRQTSHLLDSDCSIALGILKRQLSGTQQNVTTDGVFADNSGSKVIRVYFAKLKGVNQARVLVINSDIAKLGGCK